MRNRTRDPKWGDFLPAEAPKGSRDVLTAALLRCPIACTESIVNSSRAEPELKAIYHGCRDGATPYVMVDYTEVRAWRLLLYFPAASLRPQDKPLRDPNWELEAQTCPSRAEDSCRGADGSALSPGVQIRPSIQWTPPGLVEGMACKQLMQPSPFDSIPACTW